MKGSRARALIHGRNYVIPEDLFALAEDVILHRIRLTYEALADGLSGADLLREILGPFGAGPNASAAASAALSQACPLTLRWGSPCKAESNITTCWTRGSSTWPSSGWPTA